MTFWRVDTTTTYYDTFVVEADTKEEAIEKARAEPPKEVSFSEFEIVDAQPLTPAD